MSLDFAPAIYSAIVNEVSISGLLSEYNGGPAVFTRVPVPTDAVPPFIVIFPDASISDDDGINSDRPSLIRDITVYGDQPDQYRDVEQIAYSIRGLFHRERLSIIQADYDIIRIVATGPFPAPTDDESTVARRVSLDILTRAK